ncbi:MCE family protein [Gordonia sp. zg691]|uniref:MCE family protein n=1 Tax=Gordonia jinghuaiqii TaxID=2758710 RepID=A0A7D7LSP1_9ACTN|nr:MlaD family protein [Gordonia jinghuaiqii]MBD0862505.1 MCE family protein [Gordonia jinghuaiqii]MCR5976606.1 MCE family protein [Gordonia jinghuaiqii]QMS99794.1 MCE family protein [Gordonia jinghuaiqii]
MTTFRRSLITLVLFLVVSLVLSWFVFVTLQRNVSGPTRDYSAVFTDVSGLRPGDDVRVAGVRVGRVDKIELDKTVARVTFEVQNDQTLYTDTRASVTYQNIIGQRYLGLLAGGTDSAAEPLGEGGEIPVERTEPSFDIAGLLNGFEPLFSVLDPDQVQNITQTIITALQGDSGSLTSLIAQTSTLAESFAGPDNVLGDMIISLDKVTASLAGQSGSVESLIGHMRDVFTTLNSRQGEFISSIDQMTTTLGRTAVLFNDIEPSLSALIAREPGFTGHIVSNAEKFAYLFYNVPLAMKGLARFSQESTAANAYLCNVNVTIIPGLSHMLPGILAGVTPGGKVKQSPVCR